MAPTRFDSELHVPTPVRPATLLARVAAAMISPSETGFLDRLLRELAILLDVELAFVSELVPPIGTHARTLTFLIDGSPVANVEYPLAGTPCEELLAKELCVFPSGVQGLFPEDLFLVEIGAQSYAGTPLRSASGELLGLMGIIGRRPLADPDLVRDLLQIFAVRAALELERVLSEKVLRDRDEQLRQSQKMEAVGRLAGGVAHDFNNMLAVINGYSELLLSLTDPGSSMHQKLREIHRAGERAADLTRQLLAFSRRQMLEPKVIDLGQEVRDTETLLRRLISENIELVNHHAPALGRVRVDPSQITQILINLAVNARDAMPHGGRLCIETRNVELSSAAANQNPDLAPGRYVMLLISDTGCGMDSDVVRRMWEPFFTTKGVGEGTGLGLATVYGIIKQSGGHVEVESAPAQGTTFRIYFPRVDTEGAGEGEAHETSSPTGSETVLLVEDEEMVRGLARSVLRMGGYTVLEAQNGPEALRLAEQHSGPIHALLTDIVMPGGLGGWQLAERLQRQRPETRVLYMSGYTDDAVFRDGIQHEPATFIQKPFSPAVLARKLREVLENS